jgi:hypothetical protein
MPLPKRKQDRKGFMSSCMSSPAMNEEFPDAKQRAAVCNNKWSKVQGSIVIDLFDPDDDGECPECGCMPCICGS